MINLTFKNFITILFYTMLYSLIKCYWIAKGFYKFKLWSNFFKIEVLIEIYLITNELDRQIINFVIFQIDYKVKWIFTFISLIIYEK